MRTSSSELAELLADPAARGEIEAAIREYRFHHDQYARRPDVGSVRDELRRLATEAVGTANALVRAQQSDEVRMLLSVAAANRGDTSCSVFDLERLEMRIRELAIYAEDAAALTPARRYTDSARCFAASAVRRLLLSRGRKATRYRDGLAVALILHIAHEAGDRHMHAPAAEAALAETDPASKQT